MQASQRTALLSCDNLNVTLQGKLILDGISFKIYPGQIISLIGPNGAGKTTLIKTLLELNSIFQGTIKRHPKLSIGYMPQKLHIDPILPLCVFDFLSMGHRATKKEIQSLLTELKISELLYTPMQNLSGGEHQRILLARALLNEPNLLVLDEPAQGVDLIGQAELYEIIAKIRDRNHCAVLMISHDLQLVMAKTDFVVCLHQHICCQGRPEQISADPTFKRIFGTLPGLALYTHQHDHSHSFKGGVIKKDPHD